MSSVFIIDNLMEINEIEKILGVEIEDNSFKIIDSKKWRIPDIYKENELIHEVDGKYMSYLMCVTREKYLTGVAFESNTGIFTSKIVAYDKKCRHVNITYNFINIYPHTNRLGDNKKYLVVELHFNKIYKEELFGIITQKNIITREKSIKEICEEGYKSLLQFVFDTENIGDKWTQKANLEAIKNELLFHKDLYSKEYNHTLEEIEKMKKDRHDENTSVWRFLRYSGLIKPFCDLEWHKNGPITESGEYVLTFLENNLKKINETIDAI